MADAPPQSPVDADRDDEVRRAATQTVDDAVAPDGGAEDPAATGAPAAPASRRVRARLAWSERIHHAIEHDEFTLRLQPILDVRTGQINSAEALIRLVDGDELVLPERFLYIAERSGEIIDIDRWVIDKSVALLARIQQVHPDFQL